MTTAFVFSGGASLGSIQAGMARALLQAGIKPDLMIGTSAGAINAAYLAQGPTVEVAERLGEIWKGLRRETVFPVGAFSGLLGLVGQRNHLCSPDPLRRLLRKHLPYETFRDAAVPVHVVAADLSTGSEVLISDGPIAEAVLASASIPGIFPPVRIGSRSLVDGGITNNAPLSHAIEMGADTVYLMACGHACALPKAPKSALGVLLQSASVLIGRQLMHDIERYEQACTLHVVPQLCPLGIAPMDFSHAAELIDRGYESARQWLVSGTLPNTGQSKLVAPHTH